MRELVIIISVIAVYKSYKIFIYKCCDFSRPLDPSMYFKDKMGFQGNFLEIDT